MNYWYGPKKVIEGANARNDNAIVNEEHQSQSLSRPSESSNNRSNA